MVIHDTKRELRYRMMREVVSMIAGIGLALFMLYFAQPMLITTNAGEAALFNSTHPTISQSQQLGNGFYLILPIIGVATGAFLLFSYALKREVWD